MWAGIPILLLMVYIGVVWARRRRRYLRNEMGEVMGVRGKREGRGGGRGGGQRIVSRVSRGGSHRYWVEMEKVLDCA
jgi:uncharacterized membrane protein YqiK